MSTAAVSNAIADSGIDSRRPYPPSIIDRAINWVRGLPIPAWLFYFVVALAVILLHASIKWMDGSFPVGVFSWRLILGDISFIYAVGVLHYLDDSAREALNDFRPVMQIDDAEFNTLRYRFTTLPARPTLIVACLGALYGVSSWLSLSPVQRENGKFFSSPPATVLEGLVFMLTYVGAAIVIYHSVRQLRMVSLIYATHTQVDLFNLAPIYALSSVTARTAIAVLLITYAWYFINVTSEPGFTNQFDIFILSAISVVMFVAPLGGMHRLLVRAKIRAQTAAQQEFKATVAELHRRRDAGQFAEMGGINDALDGLLKEQSALDKISTWPWKTETLRGVATAVLLPILLWAVTRLLERFWTF
ncbi:MAG: hypothetical protein ABI670_17515 [Chloroflexota bacterium]